MKFSRSSLVVTALAAIAICGAPVLAAHLDNPNLLVDSSFEGTLTFDGAPFVGTWEGFNAGAPSTSAFTTTMPRTGAQALELNLSSANQFAGAFQDAVFGTGSAGANAWFSGWHKLIGDAGGAEIRIEWRNSVSDTEVSRTPNFAPPAVGSAYEEFVLATTVPAGADTARVVYAIQSFGAGVNQQVFVDDVNFNVAGVVPEPASLSLVGLCGLALVGMRRFSR